MSFPRITRLMLCCALAGVTALAGVDASAATRVAFANSLDDCLAQLADGPGVCELEVDVREVFRARGDDFGVIGPKAAFIAWNGAAHKFPLSWFHGGGHNDSGMIDVYEVNWLEGTVERIYTPPAFDTLYYSEKLDKYAWRHDPDQLPEATHTYDGIIFYHGLVIVATGAGYSGGFFSLDQPQPATTARGTGVWAFNPATRPRKGIPPRSWKRLSSRLVSGGYGRSAVYHGLLLGSKSQLYRAAFDGGRLILEEGWAFAENPAEWPGTLEARRGLLWARHQRYLWAWDRNGRRVTSFRDDSEVPHGYSLAFYRNRALYWNGRGLFIDQHLKTGEYRLFRYPVEVGDTGRVYSKFFKVPGYDDIYIGWSTPESGPIVYRHGGRGVPLSTGSLLEALAPEGVYARGFDASDPVDLDLNRVEILSPAGNGYIVLRGGPHRVRRLSITNPGRAGVWCQDTPQVTLEDFEIAHQRHGVITSNNGGELRLSNGVIRDGGGGGQFGQYHNVYAGEIDRVRVDGLQSLGHHNGGHLFKSRAPYNEITDSVFDGGTSRHSRCLDFPYGGEVILRDVTCIQSPASDNEDLLGVALETGWAEKTVVRLKNTRWVAGRADARLFTAWGDVEWVDEGGNEFIGVDSPFR